MNRVQLNTLLAGQLPDCYNIFAFPAGGGFSPNVVIIRGGHAYAALDVRGLGSTANAALHAAYYFAMLHRQQMFLGNRFMINFQIGAITVGQVNWPWQ